MQPGNGGRFPYHCWFARFSVAFFSASVSTALVFLESTESLWLIIWENIFLSLVSAGNTDFFPINSWWLSRKACFLTARLSSLSGADLRWGWAAWWQTWTCPNYPGRCRLSRRAGRWLRPCEEHTCWRCWTGHSPLYFVLCGSWFTVDKAQLNKWGLGERQSWVN